MPLPVPVALEKVISGVPAGYRATARPGRGQIRASNLGTKPIPQPDRAASCEHEGPGAYGHFRERDSPNQLR